MKIKNLSERNVGIMSRHNAEKGLPNSFVFPALATLELSVEQYNQIKGQVAGLEKSKVLKITERAEILATKADIIKAVKEAMGIELNPKDTKDKIADQALALGVEVS